VLPLVGGSANWTFGTAFTAKPSVQLTGEGAPTGTPSLWFTFVQNTSALATYVGIVVHSTNGSDSRNVHVTVTGNPN
jgi:hypothetical protein